MRDRTIAMNMSRLMRIRDDEFNVPMLSLEDFDVADTDRESAGMSSIFLDARTQIALAEMCIFLAELCIPIGEILSLHFSTVPLGGQETDGATRRVMLTGGTMLFPKFEVDAAERVALYDKHIQGLFSARPASCVYSKPRIKDLRGYGISLLVNQAYLQMLCFAIVSVLHRPQLKAKDQRRYAKPMLDDEAHKVSQQRFFEAGREISQVCHDLWTNNVEYLLPPGAVLIQIPTIMTHISSVSSQQRKLGNQNESFRAMFYSLKVCEMLQTAYHGVDAVMEFLNLVLDAANIEVVKDGNLKIVDLLYRKDKNGISLPSSCILKDIQSTDTSASAGRLVTGEKCSGTQSFQMLGETLTRGVDGGDITRETADVAAEDHLTVGDLPLLTYGDDFLFVDVDLTTSFGDVMSQADF